MARRSRSVAESGGVIIITLKIFLSCIPPNFDHINSLFRLSDYSYCRLANSPPSTRCLNEISNYMKFLKIHFRVLTERMQKSCSNKFDYNDLSLPGTLLVTEIK